MSAIGKQKNGRYLIQLSSGENEQRPKIHLGKVTRKQAETARMHIENLIRGTDLQEAAEWLKNKPECLRKRLEKIGLFRRKNERRWTVSEWVTHYIDSRPDVKEATKRKWRDVEGKLNTFFKKDFIEDVTVQHAKNFRIYLQTEADLSENSIRRHIGICRQFFNAAIEAEIIAKNPFRGQAVSVRANESRFFYVSMDVAQKVLKACPDAEWKLIFGLVRYGGLRCPSEVLLLKWTDVDFEHNRFTVHSPKTEHHDGGSIRIVPIFPELRPLFQQAFDDAKEGAIYCIERYRDTEVNLRTQMTKIIKRADLKEWPKLFQNMRSTRETELFKLTCGNIKAVCNWLGNSPAVAMKHYAQVTEADMREAAKMTILEDAEKEVQKEVQRGNAESGENPQETQEENAVSPYDSESKQDFAEVCKTEQSDTDWAVLDSNQRPPACRAGALNQLS